jgi:uncharacterized protein (TIGR02147 family)
MQSIEFYTDYRLYLRDFYDSKKRESKAFSYRNFCRKAALKSPSIYREVVEGKRNLTHATINAFIAGLNLSERDGRFFENLVLFNQSKNENTKKKYLAILRGLRYRKPQRQIPVHLFEFYDKWYNPVIRELATAIDWHGDYSLLARSVQPSIKISDARESVEMLLRLGFIRKENDNVYRIADPDITTGAEVNSLAIRQLNRNYARLGLEAIDRFPPSQRDISSVVFGIPHSKVHIFKKELAEFRRRMIELAESSGQEKTDSFYTLVLELFPIAFASDPKGGNSAS